MLNPSEATATAPARRFERERASDAFHIDVLVGAGAVSLIPQGDLDRYTRDQLMHLVEDHVALGARRVVIDLSGTRLLDSSGLQALLHINAAAKAHDHHVVFLSVPGPVRRVLAVTGMLDRLPVDVGEASPLEFVDEWRGTVPVIRLDGPVDGHRARLLGHRILAAVDLGVDRLVIDLSDAEPLVTGALLGTLLRMDRHATRHGTHLVLVGGAGTERMFAMSSAGELMTIVDSMDGAMAARRVAEPPA